MNKLQIEVNIIIWIRNPAIKDRGIYRRSDLFSDQIISIQVTMWLPRKEHVNMRRLINSLLI